MSITKKIFYSVLLLIPMWSGCITSPDIPTSRYPMEIERNFYASFDETWDAVLEVIKISKGSVIMQNKALGLISYGVADNQSESQTYVNVHTKSKLPSNTTTVRLTIHDRSGESIKFITPSLKEIDKDFFGKLENILGGN